MPTLEINVTIADTEISLDGVHMVGTRGPAGPQGDVGPSGPPGSPGVGIPPGGNVGQVLGKASTTDFDTQWVDQTGGGGSGANLAWDAATSKVTSDSGTDATITAVDGTNPGLMTVAQKSKLDGIESGATADQTGAEILAALLPVDGAGSGLDADTLDGISSAGFATAGHNHSGTYDPAGTAASAVAAHEADTTSVHGIADTSALLTTSSISDDAYDATSWNGDTTHAPSKNAVRDKIESLSLSGGSVATDAIFDAKGDLPVGTAADTAAKLTAGANDSLLVADSAQATGLKWSTVASALAALVTTRGDIITRGASAVQRLALGSAGKVLRSDGTDLVYAYPASVIATDAGATISSVGAATSVLASAITIPAGRVATGDILRFHAGGTWICNVGASTPRTVQWDFFLGGSSVFSVVTGTLTAGANPSRWDFGVEIVCINATNNLWLLTSGSHDGTNATTPRYGAEANSIRGSAQVTSVDLTASKVLDLKATPGVNSASFSVTCTEAYLEHIPKVV